MATTFQRLIRMPKRARSAPPGAKVEKGQQETGHRSDSPAAKHTRELQAFLRFVECDEGGFTEWMGRVRERWQAKLECLDGRDEVRPTRPNKLPETMEQGIPETADFCVPLNELQRSKVCPLFGHGWHGAEKSRCMLSL